MQQTILSSLFYLLLIKAGLLLPPQTPKGMIYCLKQWGRRTVKEDRNKISKLKKKRGRKRHKKKKRSPNVLEWSQSQLTSLVNH